MLARADGRIKDPKIRQQLFQDYRAAEARIPEQYAADEKEILQAKLGEVEGLFGAPPAIEEARGEQFEEARTEVHAAQQNLDKAKAENQSRIDVGLPPAYTERAMRTMEKAVTDATERSNEAAESAISGKGIALDPVTTDMPEQTYLQKAKEMMDIRQQQIARRTGKDVGTVDAPVKQPGFIGRNVSRVLSPIDTVSDSIDFLKDPNRERTGLLNMGGERFAGVPTHLKTTDDLRKYYRSKQPPTYRPPTTQADLDAFKKTTPKAQQQQRRKESEKSYLKGGGSAIGWDKEGSNNMNQNPLDMPWWDVLQKSANPAGAPAIPTPGPMQVQPPPQPSPSDVFTHQSKMKEMEGQKALIDAKSQAEQVKAHTQQQMAAAKASQDAQAANTAATAQQAGNQAQQAWDQAGQGMSQTAQMSGQAPASNPGQGQGMQPAAQMPSAQWGQPATA
jgi:hypothetical protein